MTRLSSVRGALLLGVVLPGLVLGVGWWLASAREHAALERERRALVERAGDVVRAAVDTSLDAMRANEDANPFYLYNHFYSPPDLLAVNDPVAVSPLARPSPDPRVRGHFQIDPGRQVRTPYAPEARAPAEAFSDPRLAGLSLTDVEPLFSFAHPAPAPEPTPSPAESEGNENAAPSRPPPGAYGDVDARSANEDDVGQQYTVSLNAWSNKLADSLQKIQSDESQQMVVLPKKRVAPKTSRRNVEWKQEALPAQQQAQRPPRPDVNADTRASVAGAAEAVDYTPMIFGVFGDEIMLVRTVSHGGATSAQVVRLDAQYLRGEWLRDMVARHTVVGLRPTLVPAREPASCVHRVAAASMRSPLAVDLCWDSSALAAPSTTRAWQGGLLAMLLLVLAAAAFFLERAARRARDLAEQQRSFVSAVSHELRTPLTTIRMNAEMLRDDLVQPAKRRRFFDGLVSESVRLSRLVENVLEISRHDGGKRARPLAPVDVCSLVTRVVADEAPLLEGRDATLKAHAPSAPVRVQGDAEALEQVVRNAVENALKYGRDDKGHADIHIDVERHGEVARITVRDHGPGVPADVRERVFERFERAPRADDEHVVGTGLGLALVRETVRAHRGQVRLEEAPGGGAALIVELPALPEG